MVRLRVLALAVLFSSVPLSCKSSHRTPAAVPKNQVRWLGRVDLGNDSRPRFAWSGAGFAVAFAGTSLSVTLDDESPVVFKAVVDGTPEPAFAVRAGEGTYTIGSGLPPGAHTAFLYRQTEGEHGDSTLLGLSVGEGALLDPPPASGRLIEAVGDSISAGFGNLGADEHCPFSFATESHWDSYVAVAARKLNAELSTIAFSGHGMYRNLDGTTSGTVPELYERTLTNHAKPTWDFRPKPQAVVLNLGTNDHWRGDPGPGFLAAALDFVRELRKKYPDALIVHAVGPMLSGASLATFRSRIETVVATRRAEGDRKIEAFEFPLQTGPFGCERHPGLAKHREMGEALAAELAAKLGW